MLDQGSIRESLAQTVLELLCEVGAVGASDYDIRSLDIETVYGKLATAYIAELALRWSAYRTANRLRDADELRRSWRDIVAFSFSARSVLPARGRVGEIAERLSDLAEHAARDGHW